MLLPVAGVIAAATVGMQEANSDVDDAIEQSVDGALPIVQLRADVSSLAVSGSRAALSIGSWDDYEARAAVVEQEFAELLDATTLTQEEDTVVFAYGSYLVATGILDEVRQTGDWRALLNGFARGMNDVNRQLGGAEAIALRELETAADNARAAESRARAVVMYLGIGAVISALALAFALSRSVLRPLRTIRRGLRRLADGDLGYRLAMRRPDEIGEVATAVDTMADKLQRAHAELAHRSLHDALTGLPNRVLFLDRTEHALRRMERNDESVTIMLVDLDGFKEVNDGFGHHTGDRVLVEAAHRIVASLRSVDTASRLGGDEFALLIEKAGGDDDALALAERVLAALEAPFELDGNDVGLGASIGVAIARVGASPAELLRDADLAMYEAKSAGKNRLVVFETRMQQAADERAALAVDLRRAIDEGQLALEFQPIVEIATRRPRAFEALVRWDHPTHGRLVPDRFVPVAEETGLIGMVGQWVLREACRQLQEWRDENPAARGMSVCVNLSSRQLHRAEIVDQVAGALAATGLPPALLTLEVTENAAIERGAGASLAQLRALGVRLAIDNFGTGSASIAQLNDLPVDVVKIDSAFVPSGKAAPENTSLLSAIIAVARSMDLTPVAEGVETEYQANVLQMLGCRYAQGFGVARPASPQEIAEYLRTYAARGITPAYTATGHPSSPAAPAFAVLAGDGRVRHASAEIAALLGYTQEEKIDTNFLDLVHPDDRSRAVESFLVAQTTPGEHGPLWFRVQRGDGDWQRFEVRSESRVDDPGVLGVIVTLTPADIVLSEPS